jgi:AhpD family alkylhydroperoxidase
MRIEQREKELAAIGASIGCNCRPCIEHHIPAGREAGLSEVELADAVATARRVRAEAITLLERRVDELLADGNFGSAPAPPGETAREHALVALGASLGANSHPLLRRQIGAASEIGLSPGEIAAAVRMAACVQQRASEMTAESAKHALHQLGSAVGSAAARSPQEVEI